MSNNKTEKKWNETCTNMGSPKKKVKSSPTEYTAPYFVSHLDSMSSTELTSHLHSFHVSLTFWNLCRSSRRLCRPVPYGPMQRLCHPAHSFSFVVSQNSFNSIKLQISNPRFPLLLFTLSHTQTHKLHYRSTSLSGYSAKLQCCKSH